MVDRDAGFGQDLRLADARQLQQMRRPDGTGGEDHLTRRISPLDGVPCTAARELDPYRARAVENHAMHQRCRDDLEVGPL